MKTLTTRSGLVLKVDDDTFELLQAHRWALWADPSCRAIYVTVRIEGRSWYLHRWIMQAPPGMQVHHRDGDGLNNCRENLEVLNPGEHGQRHTRQWRNGHK